MTKSIFKSKTLWLNAIMGLMACAAFIEPEFLTALGFAGDAQQKILTIVGVLTAIGNIFLRMLTNQPLEIPKKKK